ncbi:MAG: hypothetical protein HYZ68_04120 [Chloroflexi bacterium]|nr:hypothetical protein [Chloroflexota bacterium]
MEFREYWPILARRWWLVVAVPLIAVLASLPFHSNPQPLYIATLRMTVAIELPGGEPLSGEELYNLELASEFIADDLSVVVRSLAFAQTVSQRLAGAGIAVPPGAIQGFTAAQKEHRILSLVITWPDPQQLSAIARAAVEALETKAPEYFDQLQRGILRLHVIDGPGQLGWSIAPLGVSLREKLELPIRALLGLVAGVGLALAWHHFDPALYSAGEVESLGVRVIGQIPRMPRWDRLFGRRALRRRS